MKLLRPAVTCLLVLLVSVPLAIATALALLPLWKWLEANQGIEAHGHSGPAEWCYLASYAGCVVLLAAGVLFHRRRESNRTSPGDVAG